MGILSTIFSAFAAIACLINPVWGFCAYVATLIIRPNEQFEGVLLPATVLMTMAIGIAFLFHLGRKIEWPAGTKSKAAPLMVAMLILLAIHLLLWRTNELIDWMTSEFAPVLLILLFATGHMATPKRLQAVFTTVMFSASTVAGIPFFVHFFYKGRGRLVKHRRYGEIMSYGQLWDAYHGPNGRLQGKQKGMWGNSNDLGMVANWAIPGALFYLRRKGGTLAKIFCLLLLCMLLGVVMLTGSRGSQLQLGITLWMVFVGGKRKVLGLFMLAVALAGILVVLPRISPERADAAASSGERQALLGAGITMFKWKPFFGVGFNSFEENAFHRHAAHNVYLQCLAETGLLGSSIFFPLIFFLRRETGKGVKHFDKGGDPNMAALARSIGALQFSFSVFILFSNQFMRFTFALVMVLGIVLYKVMQRDTAQVEV